MFRYRCPHCSQLLQALEVRAGKSTVCSKCSRPLTIPADQSQWLNERGEALLAASASVPAELVPAGGPDVESHAALPHGTAEFHTPATQPQPPAPTPPPQPAPDANDPDRRRRLVVSRPAPPRPAAFTPPPKTPPPKGATVLIDEPAIRPADLVDEIAGRLSSRMKPPPTPPRDVRPTTALWMIGTGIGIALLIAALLTTNDFLPAVAAIGVAEIVFGALWIVWMAYQREPRRGFLALLPPVNLWFMTQRKYAKFRPLRFAVTGAVLIASARASGYALPVTRAWAGGTGKTPAAVVEDDTPSQPKLVQLRTYRDRPDIRKLLELLEDLAKTDELKSEDARDRAALARDLKGLTVHRDSGVRIQALEAYARWGGDDARSVALKFLESPNQAEREAAIRLLPRWRDPEAARAVAAQLGRSTGETTAAVKSLQEFGPPLAEDALIPQLEADDAKVRLLVMELLAKTDIGGPVALAKLRQMADSPPPTSKAFDDPGTRLEAGRKAEVLAKRLQK